MNECKPKVIDEKKPHETVHDRNVDDFGLSTECDTLFMIGEDVRLTRMDSETFTMDTDHLALSGKVIFDGMTGIEECESDEYSESSSDSESESVIPGEEILFDFDSMLDPECDLDLPAHCI